MVASLEPVLTPVSDELFRLCLRHGIDLRDLSEEEIISLLPLIAEAIKKEGQSFMGNLLKVLSQAVEVKKSADLSIRTYNEIIPNAGLTRDESLDRITTPVGSDDRNEIFESLIPF